MCVAQFLALHCYLLCVGRHEGVQQNFKKLEKDFKETRKKPKTIAPRNFAAEQLWEEAAAKDKGAYERPFSFFVVLVLPHSGPLHHPEGTRDFAGAMRLPNSAAQPPPGHRCPRPSAAAMTGKGKQLLDWYGIQHAAAGCNRPKSVAVPRARQRQGASVYLADSMYSSFRKSGRPPGWGVT